MIEIQPTEDNGFGCYIHFFYSMDGAEEILIERCARCIGIIILWRRKKDASKKLWAPKFASIGFHIPPQARKAKSTRRQFFHRIKYLERAYDARFIVYCGGKIDTSTNKVHYKNSKDHFVSPLIKRFPKATVVAVEPLPEQASSTLYMNEFLEFTIDRYAYAPELIPEN